MRPIYSNATWNTDFIKSVTKLGFHLQILFLLSTAAQTHVGSHLHYLLSVMPIQGNEKSYKYEGNNYFRRHCKACFFNMYVQNTEFSIQLMIFSVPGIKAQNLLLIYVFKKEIWSGSTDNVNFISLVPQQKSTCPSEQWEQTARTTADSCNETHFTQAALTKTEGHVLGPRANMQQTAPTSGKITLLPPRISPTPQGLQTVKSTF